MITKWLGTSWLELGLVVISTVGIFLSVIVYTRLAGLRSFSKMSSFDFAITVSFGSLMATVAASPSATLPNGVVALGVLYGMQTLIALGRRRGNFSRIVDNAPKLIMAGDRMIEANLRRGRITEDDVRGKLREANCLNYAAVRAVVLESTGDVSVLHGTDELDLDILRDVMGYQELAEQAKGGGVREGDQASG
ncbi:MAG: DUF421 domain-containing protein [Actinomycetota bacterium]|nr:DUF421 domain-containing protein [Actinomycetota bacterium]MDP8931601.1 DUF421 domain-containing protein [Actinomycetota bacterium]